MSWFSKKEEKKTMNPEFGNVPELPKLPELPKTKIGNLPNDFGNPSQLPSYPSNSFGEKFSQNAIKDAVRGERGEKEEDEDWDVDEPADSEEDDGEMHNLHKPKMHTREMEPTSKIQGAQDSVFVRLDKFEDGLHKFGKAKEKVSEIESLITNLKKVNEKEMKELMIWEKEVKTMKNNFEKIDKDIFSKI
ncbi:MAG: hypothetical protein WDZ77_01325 [Candidatus Pacearchaeota archaeon]